MARAYHTRVRFAIEALAGLWHAKAMKKSAPAKRSAQSAPAAGPCPLPNMASVVTTLILVTLVGLFLGSIQGVLIPFVVGFVVAYMLAPTVARMTRWMPQSLAAALCVIAVVAAIVVFFALIGPVIIGEVAWFIGRVPDYLNSIKTMAPEMTKSLGLRLRGDVVTQLLAMYSGKAASLLLPYATNVVGTLAGGVATVVNIVGLILVTPLVAYYLLVDWKHVNDSFYNQLPAPWRPHARSIFAEIDTRMAGWLRGQITVCLVLAVFYAAGLSLVGLDMGIVVGILCGLLACVPMVGPMLGGIFVLLAGLLQFQFGAWEPYAALVAVLMLGQVLEGNILTPKLVGGQTGLHPLWIVFALLAGGSVGGFLGLLLAVPTAVVLRVLVPRAMALWRATVA